MKMYRKTYKVNFGNNQTFLLSLTRLEAVPREKVKVAAQHAHAKKAERKMLPQG